MVCVVAATIEAMVFGYTNAVDKAGVIGLSIRGDGVVGESYRNGVVGRGDNYGVTGYSPSRIGVYGTCPMGGVFGTAARKVWLARCAGRGVFGGVKRLWCVWRDMAAQVCMYAATALVCLI